MPRVLMPLFEGVEETEAVATIDVLRRGGVDVVTASVGGAAVTAGRGVRLLPDADWTAACGGDYDAIVLPGGPGTAHLNDMPGLVDLLRAFATDGKWVAAICAAPTVLAGAGLLQGRRATCFPAAAGRMAGAVLAPDSVVVDGRLITSRAVGTALDFALTLVSVLVSADKASEVGRSILHDGW